MEKKFLEQWIEYDYNPFILFSQDGKVISLNQEAEHLLSKVQSKTIFELAMSYASVNFGFNTIFIDLNFDRFNFFGITVGYESDNEIGVKLHKNPPLRLKSIREKNTEFNNIYSLIDLAISTNSIQSDSIFKKEFDPTLPEIKIDTSNFIKLLDKIYKQLSNSKTITTKLYLKIGEFIKYNQKRYKLFIIEITIDSKLDINEFEIKALGVEINSIITVKDNSILIELPMITE